MVNQYKVKKQSELSKAKFRKNSKPISKFEYQFDRFLNFNTWLVEHWLFIVITTIITIYALIADDLRQLISSPPKDPIFYILILICFGIFTLEIILSSCAKNDYLFGFYFWLDIISTLTLLLDVGWISDSLFGTSSNADAAISGATLARAARASKIGSRAGRIVRILRLIRLIRIIKLYKTSEQIQIHDKKNNEFKRSSTRKSTRNKTNRTSQIVAQNPFSNHSSRGVSNLHKERVSLIELIDYNKLKDQPEFREARKIDSIIEGDFFQQFNNEDQSQDINQVQDSNLLLEKNMMEKETNVGKKLSDATTKRVVVIVLLIMISIPVFSTDTYFTQYSSYQFGLQEIKNMLEFEKGVTTIIDNAWQDFIEINQGQQPSLINLSLSIYDENNPDILKQYGDFKDTLNYRSNELEIRVVPEDPIVGQYYIIAYYNNKRKANINAILSILRTIFVCVVLAFAAVLFSKDASDLVLTPIENMLRKINNITQNPLEARNIEEEEAFLWEKMFRDNQALAQEMEEKENYETSILEKIIVKIGGLLAIGFGQAGSEIIVQNMRNNGGINPMIPGKKIIAIFGFCDIRNFTDATEILKTEVMIFVNQIAEIVHSEVDKFAGAANKNIGDAFLVCWKFDENQCEIKNGELKLKNTTKVQALGDLAVMSFVNIMGKINTSFEINRYNKNKLLKERIPNYKVRMGFGLNLGWAIEGAIGSAFKIDASYLSPNVNMASRLEAATKQFRTDLLISEKLYNICSSEIQNELRKIDVVTVKGSEEPIALYTFDVDYQYLRPEQKPKQKFVGLEKKRKTFIKRQKKNEMLKLIFSGKLEPIKLWDKYDPVERMRSKYTKAFFDLWKKGFCSYESGQWEDAKKIFIETRDFFDDSQDGPSVTLLEFMESHNFVCPPTWNGIRKLTEKQLIINMNKEQNRVFDYYFATTKPDFEEQDICKQQLFDFKMCMEFEEGEFSYCKREQILYELCKYENKINLSIFKKYNIDSTKYEQICEQRKQKLKQQLQEYPNPNLYAQEYKKYLIIN